MTAHSRQGDEPREGVVLPSNGEPWNPGQNESAQVTPDQGRPWGQPWGPTGATDSAPAPAPPSTPPTLPPHQPSAVLPPHADPHSARPSGALPPLAGPQGSADETQLLPPQGVQPPGQPPGGSGADPYSARPSGAVPPQQQMGGDGDATQLIPPFSAASSGAARDPESTQQLRQLRRPLPAESAQSAVGQRQAPQPPPGAPFGVRPGAPGDRQPLAEFDNLFRPDANGTPDATQQLPVFDQTALAQQPPPRQPPYGGPQSGRRRAGGSGDGGARNPIVFGALGVVGIIAAGLLGGYALGGGGDEKKNESQGQPSAPADDSPEPKAATDPAEGQAKKLDTLLADSNNSRDAVIRSVENIKKCEKLRKAARDLRGAARQRNDLVNRLDKLSIDQLPDQERLSTELTKAWKASAAADNHYAAWADQVAGKKGCKKGQARSTDQLARANKVSGDATVAKQRAAELWNPTARKYDVTERQPAEL